MTRRHLRAPFARSLSLVLLAACGQTAKLDAPQQRMARIAGCYSLTVEGGDGALPTFAGLRGFELLSDAVFPNGPLLRRVAPPRGSAADSAWMESFHQRVWTVSEQSDSVVVAFGNGFGGPVLDLVPRGDSLVGEALLTSDTERFGRRIGRAHAVRVACAAS